MAITGIGGGNQAISADLMYQFYDNKAITPQIRDALQKRQNEAAKAEEGGGTSSASKFGPATRVSITDQIIRMNIANGTTKMEKEGDKPAETTGGRKPSRFDPLAEVKKSVAEREAAARAEKDAQLKTIADKVAADEAAKKAEGEKESEDKE